jgi:hypothetical protein
MNPKTLLTLGSILLSAGLTHPAFAGTCEGTQAIRTIAKDNATLQLGNGSRWRIARPDLIDAAAWQPAAIVLTCDETLVNLDINEDTIAHRLR